MMQRKMSDGPDDHEGGLDSQDEEMMCEKCDSGEMVKGERDIDEVSLEVDVDQFPELAEDGEGDKVVMVLVGHVTQDNGDSLVIAFDKAACVHGKMDMEPGGGGRFKRLEHALEGREDVEEPAALAAYIGRRKYGKKKMAAWSAKARGKG